MARPMPPTIPRHRQTTGPSSPVGPRKRRSHQCGNGNATGNGDGTFVDRGVVINMPHPFADPVFAPADRGGGLDDPAHEIGAGPLPWPDRELID